MRKYLFIIAGLLCCFALSSSFAGLTLKLGSLVPVGSPWDDSLKQMAGEWNRISDGKVTLKIYSGGIAGDEDDMIRKMRIGQLDAAGITAIGLSRIFSGVFTIQLPFITRNGMKPYFAENMEKKGFKVLLWTVTGQTYLFSRKPIISPADLKKQKLFMWEGNANMVKAMAELGFNPVPLAATEIMTSLQSGMIDALMTSPIAAASSQWFGIAKNMCDMKLAPFIGGIVISTRSWKKIPSDLRPKLEQVTLRAGKKMQNEAQKTDQEALKIMKKYGLKINHVSPHIKKKWMVIAEKAYNKLLGKTIHKESYEKMKSYLEEYRKNN